MSKSDDFDLIHKKTCIYVYELVKHNKYAECTPKYTHLGEKMAYVAKLVFEAGQKYELQTFKTIEAATAYAYDVLDHVLFLRRQEITTAKLLVELSMSALSC